MPALAGVAAAGKESVTTYTAEAKQKELKHLRDAQTKAEAEATADCSSASTVVLHTICNLVHAPLWTSATTRARRVARTRRQPIAPLALRSLYARREAEARARREAEALAKQKAAAEAACEAAAVAQRAAAEATAATALRAQAPRRTVCSAAARQGLQTALLCGYRSIQPHQSTASPSREASVPDSFSPTNRTLPGQVC